MTRQRSALTRRDFCAQASAALAAGTLALGTGYFTPHETAQAGLPPDLGVDGDLQGALPFPSDNPWNRDVSALPVDPNSANLIASIGLTTNLHPDFGVYYGMPYIVVPGTQPKVPITFYYASQSDPGPYPIPPNAPIEGGVNSTGDRHVLVIDRDNWILYEVLGAYPQPDGSWQASAGAIFNLSSDALRPAGWTSADAAGLPILPGLVRYDEAVIHGVIKHALRFTALTTRAAYLWPARHYASSNTSLNVPAMGTRVRLKASFDISSFPPVVQVILTALKTYGMMLADNGGNWFISGANDVRWDDTALQALKTVPGSNFEVVQVTPQLPMTILNPSFESPALASPGGYTTAAPASWTKTGSGGVFQPILGSEANSIPNGLQVAWLSSGGSLFQDLGIVVDSTKTYRLTISVGTQIDNPSPSDGYRVDLVAGGPSGTVIAEASGTLPAKAGFLAVSVTGKGAGSGNVGVLITATAGQPLFDNLQLQIVSSINVLNPSFESPALASAGGYTTAAPPGWTMTGQGGTFRPIVGSQASAIPDGAQVVWLNSGGSIFQDLGVAVDPNSTYQLNMSVGTQLDNPSLSDGYRVDLVAGGAAGMVIAEVSGSLPGKSPFVPITLSGKGAGSGNLGVLITATSGQPLFDNVQVQAVS